MNFLKTQLNSFVSCHKQVASQTHISLTNKNSNQLFFLQSPLITWTFICLIALSLVPTPSFAKDPKNISDILKLKTAPSGVVIEIVTWGGDNLQWALPRAKQYIKKLRVTFPKLPVAIVSHGAEQFALTNDEKEENKEVHQLVKSFGNDDVPVHVCETFAGWRGLSANDFPDYVNVAAAGPAQVNDYLALGYELIIITDED